MIRKNLLEKGLPKKYRGGLLEDIADFLDGKKYKLDGIAGTIRARYAEAIYPYKHTTLSIFHEASPAGKKTEAYLKIRRELRNDWTSELTESDRISLRLFEIAEKLGYKLPERYKR